MWHQQNCMISPEFMRLIDKLWHFAVVATLPPVTHARLALVGMYACDRLCRGWTSALQVQKL